MGTNMDHTDHTDGEYTHNNLKFDDKICSLECFKTAMMKRMDDIKKNKLDINETLHEISHSHVLAEKVQDEYNKIKNRDINYLSELYEGMYTKNKFIRLIKILLGKIPSKQYY